MNTLSHSYVRYQKYLKYIPLIVVVLVVLGISIVSRYFSSIAEVVALIGTDNAYVILFIMAFLSGLTTFSVVPYHAAVIVFASAGINPLFIALTVTAGVMLGDATSYYIGYSAEPVLPERLKKILTRLNTFVARYPKLFPIFVFLYGALVPFSNDFIGITMGAVRYPFWRIMIPLALGNIVFNTIVGYAAHYFF